MKIKLLSLLITIILFVVPNKDYGQAPDLGTAGNYVLFTGVGAVTSSSSPIYLTHLTGNVGSNSGAGTGFGNVDGVFHSGDVATATALADLLIAYASLNTATATAHPVSPTMGGGDTLNAGVYALPSATTLNGNLILNGNGDANAVFIFQIPAEFSANSNSKIILINGALACNVFWKTEGLVSISTGVTMRGTIVAHNGAINLNAGDTLEGRALSTVGAISVNQTLAYMPIGCGSPFLTGPAAPPLGATKSYAVFSTAGAVTNAGTSHYTGDIGAITAAPTGFDTSLINGTIHFADSSATAASASLGTLYTYLNSLSYDIELTRPDIFGHNLVLTPHTYLLNAATTLIDTVILNAENNPNAIFVFQVVGAFSPQSLSYVKLINGAKAKNVYWVVTGATTIATNSVFNGNIIGGGGAAAIILATGVQFNGRAMTTNGAVTINGANIVADVLPVAGPLTGDSSVCVGSSMTLSGVDTGGTWHASNSHATVTSRGIVTGITAGIDTIRYIVINDFGADTSTREIVVNPLPVAGPITGPSSVCVDSTITISGVDSGGVFSRSNTNATVSTAGLITGVSPGLDTIKYKYTNMCGSDSASKIITINPTANAGVITGLSAVCVGSSITLANTATGGTWSSTNARATITSAGVVTGVTSGTDTIRYIVSGACGRDTATKIININPAPNAGTISGLSTVCTGTSITLTDAASGGTWSASNAHATVVGGVVTGATVGLDTISYSVTNSCGTAIATKVITVTATANAGTITGLSTVCVASSITLTDASTGGTWSASNTTASVSSTGVVTGAFQGTDTISYTVVTSCGTDIATKVITVNPLPNAGTITGLSTVCTATSITLTDAASGGTWSASNTHATVVGGVVTGLTVGLDTISYSVTNSCGTAIATKVITVTATANAGTITGLSTVCVASSITLTDASTGGTWTASNTTASISSTGVVTGAFQGTDTISYTVVTSCGTDIATKVITVNPLPNAGTITGLSTVCTATSITLTDAVSGGTWSASNTHASVVGGVVTGLTAGLDTIFYSFTNTCGTDVSSKVITIVTTPNAGTITGLSSVCVSSSITLSDASAGGTWSASNITASVSSTGVVTGAFPGTDTIKYTVVTGCGTDIATKVITVNPLPNAGTITGLSTVCTATSITLTDAVTGGTWSASNTHASVVGGVVTGLTAGLDTIFYSFTNTCGTDVSSKVITIVTTPNARTITGLSSVCVSSSITLSDASAGGTWSASNITASVSSTGVVTGAFPGTDTINYTVVTGCGTDVATKVITVNPLPNAGTITGFSSVCVAASITLTDASTGGTWSSSNTTASVTSAGVVSGNTSGIDTIMYTVTNGCGTATASKAITVNPLPNSGTISGPNSVCVGSSITLSESDLTGTWTSTNGNATITSAGIVMGITPGFDTIVYTVSNICATVFTTHTVTINALPLLTSTITPAGICDSSVFNYTATSDSATALLTWTRPVVTGISNSANSGIGSISEALVNTTSNNQVVTYIYTISDHGCSTTQNVSVTVFPTPRLAGVLSQAICSGSPFTFLPTSTTTGTTFTWKRAQITNILPDTASGAGDIHETLYSTASAAVNVIYIYTSTANGCSFKQSLVLQVNPLPTLPVISTKCPLAVCAGTMNQNFGSANAPAASVVYNWTATNAIVWATGYKGQNAIINFPNPGTATISLTSTAGAFPCKSKDTYTVNVGTSVAEIPEVKYFEYHFVCLMNNEDSYQWGYDNISTLDSTMLPGEINQDYLNSNPDFTNKYYWVMTSKNGCSQKTYFNNPTAIKNITMDGITMDVHPNPADGLITAAVNTTIEGDLQIEVTNMTGQKLSSVSLVNHKAIIDVAELPAGIYLISCYRNGVKLANTKFVKN